MPITRSRLLLTLGLGAAFIAWYFYWSSPGVQIPKTFARIREGVNESRANLIIDQLHPEYSIKRCWPNTAISPPLGSCSCSPARACRLSSARMPTIPW